MILHQTDMQLLLTIGKIGGILTKDIQTMWEGGLTQSTAQRIIAKLRKLKLIQTGQAWRERGTHQSPNYYGHQHYITRRGIKVLQDAYPYIDLNEETCMLPRYGGPEHTADVFLSKALTTLMYHAPHLENYSGMDIRRNWEPRRDEGHRLPHIDALVTMYFSANSLDHITPEEHRDRQWYIHHPQLLKKLQYLFLIDRGYSGQTITAQFGAGDRRAATGPQST